MKLLTSLVALAALGAAAALATIYLGLPDIAATTPHWKLTEWVLSTTMENGVRRRAARIAVPDDLDAPERIHSGASDYDEMCAACHAAPGVESAELAKGLLPPPPELTEEADGWSPAELFWIIKHGVRMTGMPAFGPTHSDRRIWDMVAFLRQLPGMSAATYHALADQAGEEHHHDSVEH
jgi:mono/diheme cytochrome c family protein